MNIIYIDKKEAAISIKNKQLLINTQKIPFKLIDTIVLGGNYTLTTKDILTLTNSSISLLLLNNNPNKSAVIYPAGAKNSELKLKQFQKASTNPLEIAKYILNEKIKTHNLHLQKEALRTNNSFYEKIKKASSLDELLGIEGSFSKFYFQEYFSLFPKNICKGKRTKRPPLDALNAILSFSYTLFYNLIAITLLRFGFEPAIGFLHRPFREHFALSSDILEIFRASINAFAKELFASKTFTINDFTKKDGVYLKYSSRKKFWSEFNSFYHSLESQIDNQITTIRSML